MKLTAGGRTLSGFSAGDGPTVLLVHGWSDRAASLGAFVEPFVQRGFRVVGLDFPGHGDSPGGRTNAFEMAATLRAIDRELGGVDAMVAHSIGAFATVLELANGLEPRAVGLIAPLVRVDDAVDRFAQRLRLPSRAVKALRADLERKFGTDVWDKLSADLQAVRLDVPALVVHDQDDPETRPSDSALLAQAWPGARMISTRGLGHYRVVRDEIVVAEIADFISGANLTRQPS
jgi:pimeloyl-ACP methyl ester carboxylesterase